jgi:hypothetical protein
MCVFFGKLFSFWSLWPCQVILWLWLPLIVWWLTTSDKTLSSSCANPWFQLERKFRISTGISLLDPWDTSFSLILSLSHSFSHNTARHHTVWKRCLGGDLEVWPRISRCEGRLLVVPIQRFWIPLPNSISNPFHHESRYKINVFTRSPYLGLPFSIPLVDQLHLHPYCYSNWWTQVSMVDFAGKWTRVSL